MNLTPIGYTKKAHGIRGQLRVHVEKRFERSFVNADVVFIETGGAPVPYFVETISDTGGLLLKLEELDQREAVVPLTGAELSLKTADIQVPEEEEEVELTALVGYEIVDKTLGKIGEIEEVVELPEQVLAQLTYDEKEVLIPLVDAFILELTHRPPRLLMDLPEGLLDL